MTNKESLESLLAVSVVSLLILIQMPCAAAANNQGLEWGFEVNDRFDYDIEVDYHNATIDLEFVGEMYVIVDDLPELVDDIYSSTQFSVSLYLGHYTTYWANGTVMDSLWEDVFHVSPFTALPIGNWTLVAEIMEGEMPPSATLTQDSSILNITVVNLPNPGNEVAIVLLKSDGASQFLMYNQTWGMETTVYIELTRPVSTTTSTTTSTTSTTTTSVTTSTTSTTATSTTTSTTSPLGDSALLLVLGAAILVVVVLGFIVIIRRKQNSG